MFFKGRSIIHKERGEIHLKLAQDLEEIAKADQMPKLEGKRMIMLLFLVKNKWEYVKNENKLK